MVNAMIDQEDWHQIGLNEEVSLTKEFKEFRFEFTASETVAKGTVFVKELTLSAKRPS